MSVWAREDLREAFAAQLADREAAIASGAVPIGWKLGFGTPAARESLAIDAPLIGYLLESGVLESGTSVSLGGWSGPKIETEIVVRFGRDVPAKATGEEITGSIESLRLAFELVDFTFAPGDAAEIMRANVFQRHVVFGDAKLVGVAPPPVDLIVDGHVTAPAAEHGTAVGDLTKLIGHLASVLGELGPGLKAGDVLITGALAPAAVLEPGQVHSARAEGLGEISLKVTE